MGEYIAIKEYAEKYGVSVSYIRRLISNERLENVRFERGRYYIDADSEYPKDKRIKSGNFIGWRKKAKND